MDKHQLTPDNAQALLDITQNTIWLMGGSFLVGVFFTLFILLMLDFVRRDKEAE